MDDMDSGSFFDHIDDLVEFPSDNDCGVNEILRDSGGGCNDFPSIWDNEALPDAYPPFPESNRIAACELSAELSVPYEDIIQLEWLSTFVEDSFSGGGMTLTQNHSSVSNNNTSQNQFHTSSPVSVLESSSSSSSSTSAPKYIPLGPTKRGPHRARSKRPRPATFNPRSMIQFMCPSPTPTPTPTPTPSPTNTLLATVGSEHPPAEKLLEAKPPVQKPKKLKIKVPFSPLEINEKTDTLAVRKCMHCEITKTPQWRAGPMGPKTLCNACGVRYKSGRLFPEYRPAASPTFVPSLHSNSHKKVVQMRSNVVVEPTTFKKDSVFVGNKPPGGGYISK